MTITSTQVQGDKASRIATGAYLDDAATPAAANLSLGFKPKFFQWRGPVIEAQWWDSMPAASKFTVIDSGAGTTDMAFAASAGLTHYSGASGVAAEGITVDASLIAQNVQYYWVAIG